MEILKFRYEMAKKNDEIWWGHSWNEDINWRLKIARNRSEDLLGPVGVVFHVFHGGIFASWLDPEDPQCLPKRCIWLVVFRLPLWKIMEWKSVDDDYYSQQKIWKIIHSCSKPPTRICVQQYTVRMSVNCILYQLKIYIYYNLIDTSNGLVMFANFHQLFNYSILEMVLCHTKMFWAKMGRALFARRIPVDATWCCQVRTVFYKRLSL